MSAGLTHTPRSILSCLLLEVLMLHGGYSCGLHVSALAESVRDRSSYWGLSPGVTFKL